jgi:hypothetical protein
MSRDLELLAEIRDLLQVIAEPALAKRDAKLRASLRKVVGNSAKKAKAATLMDGARSRPAILKESGIDPADLSRLVKALTEARLIVGDEKHPALVLRIPPAFFDKDDTDEP